MANDTNDPTKPPPRTLNSRLRALESLQRVIDANIKASVMLTSRRVIADGEPPRADMLLLQMVANQVSELQAMRELIGVNLELVHAINFVAIEDEGGITQ